MFGLNETMDHLAMTISIRWNGHVLRREDNHVSRRALDFVAEGLRKMGRTWKKLVEDSSMEVGLSCKDALC